MNQGAVIGVQILANIWVDTAGLTARRLDLWALTADPVHVGCRSTEIRDNASKARHLIANIFNLADHGVFTAALNNAPFVLGDRTERAATKTTAHDVDAEPNHFPRRDLSYTIVTAVLIRINRMGTTGVGQIKDQIHLGGRQGNRWRINPHITRGAPLTMRLHDCTCIPWVGLEMQDAVRVRIQDGIRLHLLIGRQTNHTAITRRHLELTLDLGRGVWGKNKRCFTCFQLLFTGTFLSGAFGVCRISHRTRLIVTRTAFALLERLLANHQVRINVSLYPARRIHTRRIDFEPALRRLTP